MVDERYEDEHQEESEYHFSDDQVNYDMEADASVKGAAGAVAASPKESIAEKLKQHRRMVIGIVVFVVLLGIVYKLVTPSSGPATDFQQAPSPSSAKAAMKRPVTPPSCVSTLPFLRRRLFQKLSRLQPFNPHLHLLNLWLQRLRLLCRNLLQRLACHHPSNPQ